MLLEGGCLIGDRLISGYLPSILSLIVYFIIGWQNPWTCFPEGAMMRQARPKKSYSLRSPERPPFPPTAIKMIAFGHYSGNVFSLRGRLTRISRYITTWDCGDARSHISRVLKNSPKGSGSVKSGTHDTPKSPEFRKTRLLTARNRGSGENLKPFSTPC